MNMQYTLGRSRGTSGGSNEANTAANNARTLEQFEYDDGYNNFDVRHTFNMSLLYSLPLRQRPPVRRRRQRACADALLGGWEIGGIVNARSGVPVPVLIVATGRRLSRWRRAISSPIPRWIARPSSTRPGGGASRNVRRPDLVPGVDPYIKDGGLLFLNPAAFATPPPGTFGNLERNKIHGPGFKQVDFFFAKHFAHRRPHAISSSAASSSTCSTR